MTTGLRRDPVIQARLDAWARWLHSGSSWRGGGHPLAMLMDLHTGQRVTSSSGYSPRANVPCDEIECARTHAAVTALPEELRRAVRAWHDGTGTMEQVAAQLGVVRATLHRRLCQADQRIAQWLASTKRPSSRDAVTI